MQLNRDVKANKYLTQTMWCAFEVTMIEFITLNVRPKVGKDIHGTKVWQWFGMKCSSPASPRRCFRKSYKGGLV